MRRPLLFLLSLAFCLPTALLAQIPIEKSKVPSKVIKVFEKKNKKSTEITWYQVDDGYQVDFTNMRAQNMEITYDQTGRLMQTKTFYKEKELPSKVRDYVKKEYGHLKFDQAYFYEDAEREKRFVILLTDKVRGFDEPFTWEVWLNSAGRHITTFEPDIPDLAGAAGDEEIDKKDLPSKTLNWLKENYDYEWNYDTILIRDDPKLGTVYYIVMKWQGYPDTWEHYFDYKGNLIRKTRIDQE